MAERGRFELPEPVKVQRFSRPPQSTTLPPLRDSFIVSSFLTGLYAIDLKPWVPALRNQLDRDRVTRD